MKLNFRISEITYSCPSCAKGIMRGTPEEGTCGSCGNTIIWKGDLMKDNWKHRSDGMKCGSCMWYSPKIKKDPAETDQIDGFGRCRRHSPTISGFPAVFFSDWCGDHKINEEVL